MDPRLLDKNWRMRNFYKVRTKDNELITFRPNRMQRDFSENATNRNISLKSRQLGMTTYECVDSLDDTLFTRNFDALMIAHQKEETEKLFDTKIEFPWKQLDAKLRSLWDLDVSNAKTMKFGFKESHGAQSTSSISVALSARSGTYSRVHISEFGKICKKYPDKAWEIVSGTFPAVPISGRIDIESTAESEEGYFASMFWTAWKRQGGKNYRKGDPKNDTEFSAFFYNWTWDDEEINRTIPLTDIPQEFLEYQKKYSLTDKQITYYYKKWVQFGADVAAWKMMKKEYPTTPEEAFETSGNKLFDKETIDKFKTITPTKRRDFLIYHPYIPGHRYALGADVSEGVGGDSSTGAVIDFSASPRPTLAATYASKRIPPDQFGYVLRDLGMLYGKCLIAPERNNHGHTTIAILKGIYPISRIYQEKHIDRVTNEPTNRLGWHTNGATKPKMFFDLASAVDQGLIDIESYEVLQEMLHYDRDFLSATKTDPDATNHFDILTALAIAWQMKSKVSYKMPPPNLGFGGAGGYGIDWQPKPGIQFPLNDTISNIPGAAVSGNYSSGYRPSIGI